MKTIKIKCNHCNGTGKRDLAAEGYLPSIISYAYIFNSYKELTCEHCNGEGFFKGEIIK